jgi:hypothetical protein
LAAQKQEAASPQVGYNFIQGNKLPGQDNSKPVVRDNYGKLVSAAKNDLAPAKKNPPNLLEIIKEEKQDKNPEAQKPVLYFKN